MEYKTYKMKKTLVLSASLKPYRYSHKAVCLLNDYNHEVVAIGSQKGKIHNIKVQTDKVAVENVDTVTLYLSPRKQAEFYDYIVALKPKRIIMNPGTENPEFKELAIRHNIEVIEHCTLVMLNMGVY